MIQQGKRELLATPNEQKEETGIGFMNLGEFLKQRYQKKDQNPDTQARRMMTTEQLIKRFQSNDRSLVQPKKTIDDYKDSKFVRPTEVLQPESYKLKRPSKERFAPQPDPSSPIMLRKKQYDKTQLHITRMDQTPEIVPKEISKQQGIFNLKQPAKPVRAQPIEINRMVITKPVLTGELIYKSSAAGRESSRKLVEKSPASQASHAENPTTIKKPIPDFDLTKQLQRVQQRPRGSGQAAEEFTFRQGQLRNSEDALLRSNARLKERAGKDNGEKSPRQETVSSNREGRMMQPIIEFGRSGKVTPKGAHSRQASIEERFDEDDDEEEEHKIINRVPSRRSVRQPEQNYRSRNEDIMSKSEVIAAKSKGHQKNNSNNYQIVLIENEPREALDDSNTSHTKTVHKYDHTNEENTPLSNHKKNFKTLASHSELVSPANPRVISGNPKERYSVRGMNRDIEPENENNLDGNDYFKNSQKFIEQIKKDRQFSRRQSRSISVLPPVDEFLDANQNESTENNEKNFRFYFGQNGNTEKENSNSPTQNIPNENYLSPVKVTVPLSKMKNTSIHNSVNRSPERRTSNLKVSEQKKEDPSSPDFGGYPEQHDTKRSNTAKAEPDTPVTPFGVRKTRSQAKLPIIVTSPPVDNLEDVETPSPFKREVDNVLNRGKAKSTTQSPKHQAAKEVKVIAGAKATASKMRNSSRGRSSKPLYEFDFYDHEVFNGSQDPSFGASKNNYKDASSPEN